MGLCYTMEKQELKGLSEIPTCLQSGHNAAFLETYAEKKTV